MNAWVNHWIIPSTKLIHLKTLIHSATPTVCWLEMVNNSLGLFGAIFGGKAKTDITTGNIMSKMYITEMNFLFIGLVKYKLAIKLLVRISSTSLLLPLHQYIPPLKGVSPYFNSVFYILLWIYIVFTCRTQASHAIKGAFANKTLKTFCPFHFLQRTVWEISTLSSALFVVCLIKNHITI